jgi:hypothetical protein
MNVLQESVTPVAPFSLSLRWWRSKPPKPFEGTVTPNGFTISRVIHYRNSFLPILNGRFTPTPTGTAITVHMTIHPLVGIIVLTVILQLGSIMLSALNNEFDMGIGLLLLGFYLVIMLTFSYEANRAEAWLREVLAPYLV